MSLLIHLFIAFTCVTTPDPEPCFTSLEDITVKPVGIDTLVLFDPQTFEESCEITAWYGDSTQEADSTVNIRDVVIGLTAGENCYHLISVTTKKGPCQDDSAAPK